VGWIDSHDAATRCDRFRLLGTLLLTQADTRALTLQLAVPVLRRIEFQAAVLARDARIIGGIGGPGDNAIGPDQSQKKDRRHDDVSHLAVLQLSVAGFTAEGS
jgi:hypothetical protein